MIRLEIREKTLKFHLNLIDFRLDLDLQRGICEHLCYLTDRPEFLRGCVFEQVASSPREPQGRILTSFLSVLRISKQVNLFDIRHSQNTVQRSSLWKNECWRSFRHRVGTVFSLYTMQRIIVVGIVWGGERWFIRTRKTVVTKLD